MGSKVVSFRIPNELYEEFDKGITEQYNKASMIIECPECGTKNSLAESPQQGKSYRCGKCGAVITLLQTVDTGVEEDISPNTVDTSTGKADKNVPAIRNTSGQGKLALVPREIEGWNWGAFLLNWLWSVSNNIWIGLLALIPGVGIIIAIVLGIKGNEWAWQNRRWDSIEHFKGTQKAWGDWGIGLLAIGLLVWLIIWLATS